MFNIEFQQKEEHHAFKPMQGGLRAVALSIKCHEETQETEYDVLEFCRLFLLWKDPFFNIFK